jgi:hydrogenase expression/formation protein HypC
MCIANPMQVIEPEGVWAWCDDDGRRERVDMRLVGAQPPGSWVLVFLGAARDVVDETTALRTRDALAALRAVAHGEPVDHLFADLIGREPELPDYLKTRRSFSE